ncbi:MAG: hypothetical protein ACI9TH_001782 [Kiritimatiellia bacterium]|jgi:hypothetical protein
MTYFPGMGNSVTVMGMLFSALVAVAIGAAEPALRILPAELRLTASSQPHGILVTQVDAAGEHKDVSAEVKLVSSNSDIAEVNGRSITGLNEGQAEVTVSWRGLESRIPIHVAATSGEDAVSFLRDVQPILTRYGCNAGACHGKLSGQNGFRLSLRAYAADWDHAWITRELSGRRVNYAFPEQSTLVQKPSGALQHEGGIRFRRGSRAWQTLVDWVGARAPGPAEETSVLERLIVHPGGRTLNVNERQQLLVQAHYADGHIQDVSWLAQYFSNDESSVEVSESGEVIARRHGECSVRVHFGSLVEVVTFTMPYPDAVNEALYADHWNELDPPIFQKLKLLHIPPSEEAPAASFVRRAYLDAIGTLPTPAEVDAFVKDTRPDRRARLAEHLLNRPEWIDYWTLQLADLLQNRRERDHDHRGVKGVRAFHTWLRDELKAGHGWDRIARNVLTAQGDVREHPEVGYYMTTISFDKLEDATLTEAVAQSFLGARIGCAKCHNHPLERYTQDDYYHFMACFSKVSMNKEKPEKGGTSLWVNTREQAEVKKRISKLEEEIAKMKEEGKPADEIEKKTHDLENQHKRQGEIAHQELYVNQPRTRQRMAPQTLDGKLLAVADEQDPRAALVDWMVEQPGFSGAMVNRLWKHFFAVGIVESVDDLRDSNPPSNAALWDVTRKAFVESGFDLKQFMRLILTSRAYALQSDTVSGNKNDTRFFSRYYPKRLPAEALLDALAQVTGVPSQFDAYPVGLRAIQIPESDIESYFLSVFGRSERVTACACERESDVTLPQMLHLRNGEEIQKRINDPAGRLATWLKQEDVDAVVRDMYAVTVARTPSDEEFRLVHELIATDTREVVLRDLFWALLNSKEFAFNH